MITGLVGVDPLFEVVETDGSVVVEAVAMCVTETPTEVVKTVISLFTIA